MKIYKKFRKSVFSDEHVLLREHLINARHNLGLSQKALSDKMGVVHSLVGKIETGDRILDFIEMIEYAHVLEFDIIDLVQKIQESLKKNGADELTLWDR
jgi:ribosome-binding protein aMBF1 (putative translation factor)